MDVGTWAVTLCTLVALVVWRCVGRRSGRAPPLVSTWVPFVGCGKAFHEDPLGFLDECHRTKGDVFTLFMGGRYMTFLCHPDYYPTFFRGAPDTVSFAQAVVDFTKRVFNIQNKDFFKYHHTLHNAIRGGLTPAAMTFYQQGMYDSVCAYVRAALRDGPQDVELFAFVQKLMFDCTVVAFFGDTVAPHKAQMLADLNALDHDFETVSSGMPAVFMRSFSAARARLEARYVEAVAALERDLRAGKEPRNMLHDIYRAFPERDRVVPWLVSSLWASQANATPSTFWALSNLACDRVSMCTVREEIDNLTALDLLDVKAAAKSPVLRALVKEAMRYSSPGILVRRAMKPVECGEHVIPAGHMMCLSPFWASRDERIFAEPDKWDPARFLPGREEDKKAKFAFHPFGGGKYECPGQWFALMEMQIAIAAILQLCTITLHDEAPPRPDNTRLVGVPKPAEACMATLKLK